jgi:hypothetical protein
VATEGRQGDAGRGRSLLERHELGRVHVSVGPRFRDRSSGHKTR